MSGRRPTVLPTRSEAPLRILARLLLVVLSLLVSVLAYEPYSYADAAFLGLIFLFIALYRAGSPTAAALSFIYGAGLILLVQAWAVPLGVWPWIGALLTSGLLYSVFGLSAAYLTRSAMWPLTVASAFALLDSVIAITDSGLLTTARIIYTQTDTVLFFPVRLLGPSVVAFTAALIAALVAYIAIAIAQRADNPLKIIAAGCIAALAITLMPISERWGGSGESPDVVRVLVVQPAFENQLKMGELLTRVPDKLALSLKWVRSYASQYPLGATEEPNLAILPNGIASLESLDNEDVSLSLTRTSQMLNAPILFGINASETDENETVRYVLWGPEGKIREVGLQPLPDSESPASSGRLGLIEVAGTTYGVLEATQSYPSPHDIAGMSEAQVLIGYRSTFPRSVDRLIGRAHLTSARLMAASIDRPAVVVSEFGPSGFISEDGGLIEWADVGRAGFVYGEIAISPAGPLPARRDTLLVLLYILIPVAGVLFSLYRHGADRH